jgi:hypothetical protein
VRDGIEVGVARLRMPRSGTRSAPRATIERVRIGLVLSVLVTTAGAFEQSFTDSLFPPTGWTVVNADSGARVWQRLDIGTRTPPGCAYCGWEGYYLRNNDWLIAPQCSVATGDRFSFWCRAQDDEYRESLEVWISTGPPYLPAFTRLDAFGTNSVTYDYHEYDLPTYAGQQVFLALVYCSWNRYGLMIDDVCGPAEWSPRRDVGATRVLAPFGNMRVGRVVHPSCRVRNFTGSSESPHVSCDISGLWHGDTGLALAAYESTTVAFPELAFWQPDTYTITFATHLGADERFWNDTTQAQLAVHGFHSRGGPDSLGYVWYDSDDPLGPDYDWQELYAQGALLGWGDDSLWVLGLPWPFRFYGNDCVMAWVSTNGWLAFGPPAPTKPADSNAAIPCTYSPNRLVAPSWDDLWVKGNEGGIWYQAFADSVLVIEWHRARRKGCEQCSLDFEVKLFRNGAIEFHYQGINVGDEQYDAGMSATVGIENQAGTVGLQYLYDGWPPANLLESGRAIRFLPTPPGIEEAALPWVSGQRLQRTVVRGVLVLPEASGRILPSTSLLDISGRVVLHLHPGVNDVRGLAPGVYFVREAQAQAQAQVILKVIITR